MHQHGHVLSSYLEHSVANELVAAAVCCMEVDAAGKSEEQAVAAVGIGDLEGWVVHEAANIADVAWHVASRLCVEPLQQRQWVLLVGFIELLQGYSTEPSLVSTVRMA